MVDRFASQAAYAQRASDPDLYTVELERVPFESEREARARAFLAAYRRLCEQYRCSINIGCHDEALGVHADGALVLCFCSYGGGESDPDLETSLRYVARRKEVHAG